MYICMYVCICKQVFSLGLLYIYTHLSKNCPPPLKKYIKNAYIRCSLVRKKNSLN
ncbi:hypothetical protein DM02DRAFT_224447 [Periconia macrospinosa]|uniref:Uncharacterized protein n=1 Tax=Periconia macrospinosa TaxID=97972 RepID=A0A2V1E048_9PLEO|nr:hypothetical protein DM02DRAFT_224447 [Periconia macrospinosa]